MQYCRKCPDAVARIQGGMEAPQLSGCVQFYQQKNCVLIVAEIFGLPKSETGFSVFTFIREKAAPERTFLEQEVITILWIRSIPNMPVTYRR